MNGYYSKPRHALRNLSWVLFLVLGFSGTVLLSPHAAVAQVAPTQAEAEEDAEKEESSQEDAAEGAVKQEPEPLTWARVDFIRNRVQLVPRNQSGRRANVSDILRLGDRLRTARASRAELRFNDGSLARIGERATFRFTPNTRNFQLSNGTILLLIPPGRGRSTIQTPNAVTGIQGSALFVRYIPETDTTIVGALTNNPEGPMVLYNRDGTEQQALRANEIGVIEGDQITELYQFDGTLFWQSSGLAEGFNYLPSPTSTDELDGVREEIREAISTQGRLDGDSVITNPDSFKSPEIGLEDDLEIDLQEQDIEIQFEGSPADDYQNSDEPVDPQALEIGENNSLQAVVEEDVAINDANSAASEGAGASTEEESAEVNITEDDATESEAAPSEGSGASANTDTPNESTGADASEGAGGARGEGADGGASQGAGGASAGGAGAIPDASETDTSDIAPSVDTPGVEGPGNDSPPTGLENDGVEAGGDLGTSPGDTPGNIGEVNAGPSTGDIEGAESGVPDNLDVQTPDVQTPDVQTPDVTETAPTDDIGVNTDVTVPDVEVGAPEAGNSPIPGPGIDQLDNIEEAQTVHDLETHGPNGTTGTGGN